MTMFFIANEKNFGRDGLIQDILDLLGDKDISIVLYGEEYAGKTVIMKSILKILCNNKPVGKVCFISGVRNPKPILQECLFQLCTGIKEDWIFSNNTNADDLFSRIRFELRNSSHKTFVLIDEVNSSLPSKTVVALCSIISLGGILLVATRSLDVNKALVEKLKPVALGGLSKEDAYQMIEELLTAEKNVEDLPFLQRHLFDKTRGLPGLIKKAIDSFKEEIITRKMIKEISIKASEQTKYMFNWICVLFIMFFAINKHVSKMTTFEGGRVDFILGCIGLVLALTLRFALYPYLKKDK